MPSSVTRRIYRLHSVPGVPPARYAYLGPEGTFTEQALRSLPAAAKADLQPCSTVTVALDAVRGGEADGAVVPIENSVEGSVPVTLDELATGEPLQITREMTVPIAFSLLARPGVGRDDVRRIGTHPHAAAQTRRWCALHLPDAEVVHTTSTAHAAFMLTQPDAAWQAAISAPVGRDSMRVMFTPRTVSWSRISSSAPGWSSRMNATIEVLSRPVGGGGDPGRETSTNRVSASGLSPMPVARVASR